MDINEKAQHPVVLTVRFKTNAGAQFQAAELLITDTHLVPSCHKHTGQRCHRQWQCLRAACSACLAAQLCSSQQKPYKASSALCVPAPGSQVGHLTLLRASVLLLWGLQKMHHLCPVYAFRQACIFPQNQNGHKMTPERQV